MIEYIYDDGLVDWAEERIPGYSFREDARAFGVRINGEIRAVIVWDNFSRRSCFISVASDGSKKWFNREVARRACWFPYIQCDFARMTALVAVTNLDSLVFVRRFGFQLEGRIREGGENGDDLIVHGMLRRECRWLSKRPALPDNANGSINSP